MNQSDKEHLLAEERFLREQLAALPAQAALTRMSTQARLQLVEAALALLPHDYDEPVTARLTFNGAPVIGSHGIFADFAMRAVSSFSDAVASVAASLSAPLAAMGPIPNRDRNQLLITNTALGSFGFELEEFRGQQLPMPQGERPIAIALERTQALLKSTLGNDDDLADVASETDPRALDKIRSFLAVLQDSKAICSLEFRGQNVRFQDVGQIANSLARLGRDNLHEAEIARTGEFVEVLPNSRAFEFRIIASSEVIRGKFGPMIHDVESLNVHLYERCHIKLMETRVGGGRPRYLLLEEPVWGTPHAALPDFS